MEKSNFGLTSDANGVTIDGQNFGDSLKTIELEMEWHIKSGENEGVYTGTAMVSNNPRPNCSKCYGRGFTGYNVTKDEFKLCACVNKSANFTNRSETFYRKVKGY